MGLVFVCEPESLELSNGGTIWGNIWLEIEDSSFPSKHWFDIPVAFITSAIECLGRIESERIYDDVRFFDGDFWIGFEISSRSHQLEVSLGSADVLRTYSVELDIVVNAAEKAALKLVRECKARNWGRNSDVQALCSLLKY